MSAATPSDRDDPTGATPDELAISTSVFDVTASSVTVQHRATSSTLQANVQATARQATSEIVFDYCGPAVLFLSIDGSTVETTVEGGVLRAALHVPLQPRDEFDLRFVTTVSGREGTRPRSVPDLAAGLLCR